MKLQETSWYFSYYDYLIIKDYQIEHYGHNLYNANK